MARDFDFATSQYLRNQAAVVTEPPFSLSIWVNTDDATRLQFVFGITQFAGLNDLYGIYLRGDQAGDPASFLAYNGSTNQWADTTAGFSTGTWHHILAVCRSTTDRRCLIDGGSKGTSVNVNIPNNLDKTCMGARYFDNGGLFSRFYDGHLAQAAIYNAALPDTAAALFYYRRLSALKVRPQNLAGYWALRHGDNADWMGRYLMEPVNVPGDAASPPIVYPERDDPVWGLVLPRYRPRRYWVVLKSPVGAIYGERGTLRGVARGLARGV